MTQTPQWVENQPADMLPAFCERRGSWRPDFLVEQDTAGQEIFRITEINARFAFNGSMHLAYGAEALQSAGITGERTRLVGATSFQQVRLLTRLPQFVERSDVNRWSMVSYGSLTLVGRYTSSKGRKQG